MLPPKIIMPHDDLLERHPDSGQWTLRVGQAECLGAA